MHHLAPQAKTHHHRLAVILGPVEAVEEVWDDGDALLDAQAADVDD